jgi:RNA polymerase sigma factor (sigma-70 family)
VIDRHKHVENGDPARASLKATQAGPTTDRAGVDDPAIAAGDMDGRHGRGSTWFGRWRNWFSSPGAAPKGEVNTLAQEVFHRLLRYRDDIAVENPQGYLFRIAANVANEWRDHSRPRSSNDRGWLDQLQIDPLDQSDNAAFQARVSKHLQSAVNTLPKRQRDVLLLHVNEGLTYKQIADRLGITYRIVLRDLTRAYGALRMQLKADDL